MSTGRADDSLLHWLSRHAGFPWVRLPADAERLLCFAASAQREATGSGAAGARIVRQDPAAAAALRQHELRRSRVHFKSDNSAKV